MQGRAALALFATACWVSDSDLERWLGERSTASLVIAGKWCDDDVYADDDCHTTLMSVDENYVFFDGYGWDFEVEVIAYDNVAQWVHLFDPADDSLPFGRMDWFEENGGLYYCTVWYGNEKKLSDPLPHNAELGPDHGCFAYDSYADDMVDSYWTGPWTLSW